MKKVKVNSIIACALVAALSVTGCGSTSGSSSESENSSVTTSNGNAANYSWAEIDNSAWQYNEEDNVYYQIGLTYCETPANEDYENLSIFVPGDYMIATDNGDGTYTCEINKEITVGNYSATTAPIVFPVNTPGYSAMSPLSDYDSSVSEYCAAGFVYVHAGCRGRDDGAPSGVTDLKAAIRYIRYNDGNIAGDTNSIFSFGMSGGGAQSALLGTTGDSKLYDEYLESIGAVMTTSDAVTGSMCWCPITSLDIADEAYEWMLGSTRTGLTEDESALSDDLAAEFATYINNLGLTDEEGNVLTLSESESGIYQSGSYYEYIKSVIEGSLNNFLADTTFPYDASASNSFSMGGAPGDMKMDGKTPMDGVNLPDGDMPTGEAPSGEMPVDQDKSDKITEESIYAKDNIARTETSAALDLSGTYETAQDYIDALNQNISWVEYDSKTNTVSITSIEDFVSQLKTASKGLAAFDQLDAGQGENTLFGYADGEGAHFDSILAGLLANNDYGTEYVVSYNEDLSKEDSLGNTVDVRMNMYNPLYYLNSNSEGYGTSTIAKYFRIRTGINQSDTSLTTEVNLALELEASGADVDFETVWGQGHTEAERTGDSTSNFITWVNECMTNQ